MADKDSNGGGRFPGLLVLGVLMAIAVIVVAFVIDTEYGIPVLLLTVICTIAAIAYRVIASRGSDTDSGQGGVPKQEARDDRPLGDTPDAHDEINPHDLPLSNPGRHTAEEIAGNEGTTTGHDAGGAAGHGDDTDAVSADEAHGGARP